jgi:hypothetical protein
MRRGIAAATALTSAKGLLEWFNVVDTETRVCTTCKTTCETGGREREEEREGGRGEGEGKQQ